MGAYSRQEHIIRFLADGLNASPMPAPWTLHRDEEKRIFYGNTSTGETTWAHPLEDRLAQLLLVCWFCWFVVGWVGLWLGGLVWFGLAWLVWWFCWFVVVGWVGLARAEGRNRSAKHPLPASPWGLLTLPAKGQLSTLQGPENTQSWLVWFGLAWLVCGWFCWFVVVRWVGLVWPGLAGFGWMGGWMGGWVDGWVGGWMGGWVDGWLGG